MSDAPRRWLDSEIPSDLRDVLRSAQGDGAQAAQLARLQAKLEEAIGPGFGAEAAGSALPEASSGGSGAAVGGGTSISGALAIATALIMGLGAIWYATRTQPRELATNVPPPTPAPAAPIAQPEQPPPISASPHVTVQPPQPTAAAPRAQTAPRAPARPVDTARAAGGLMEELRQLEAIRRKLPSEPERALGAIAQHARRFPQGALGPERELLRIEALQRLGRADEARRAAEKALAGEHPYAVQIRQLMAAGGG